MYWTTHLSQIRFFVSRWSLDFMSSILDYDIPCKSQKELFHSVNTFVLTLYLNARIELMYVCVLYFIETFVDIWLSALLLPFLSDFNFVAISILVFRFQNNFHLFISFQFFFPLGLLRLQQIYQGLRPGNETFQVETVKRISNATNAIDFLRTLEELNRWSRKYIVLDCPTDMAKNIIVYHVRDLSLGRRTYHYLLSGLVSSSAPFELISSFFMLVLFPSYSFLVFCRLVVTFTFSVASFWVYRWFFITQLGFFAGQT